MSKVGKQPIVITDKIKVAIKDGAILVEGPKGKLSLSVSAAVSVKCANSNIVVSPVGNSKLAKSMFCTTRALINNMVKGVTDGFKQNLEILGVGYKAQMKGKDLVLQIGLSHSVEIKVPEEIKVSVPKPTSITIEGIDKVLVGQFTANIRKICPPEPYKGKGIRYAGEVVRKKLGKALAK